jgi:hypothetical protein
LIETILGPGSKPLVESGDQYADATAREQFIAAFDAQHSLKEDQPGRASLSVGPDGWTMPIPLLRAGEQWHFDSRTGAQQILDRRIGQNEIIAIATLLDYVKGQQDYLEYSKAASPPGAYAQYLISAPHQHDGLYWPVAPGEPPSPMAALVATAVAEGYPVETSRYKAMPYHGYFFRILKRQGSDANGGAMDYMDHGALRKGFAAVAWPASYGVSGVMTFMVNQDGIVFQKDMGSHTAITVARMTAFNPDISWAHVQITGD